MKKTILYTVFAFTLMMQTSCNRWLELLPPSGLVREEFWQSKEDVEAVLMGSYATMAAMDELLFVYGETRGDMIEFGTGASNEHRMLSEGNIYPENSLCSWTNFYKVINYCNEVIYYAPKVKEVDENFEDYHMKGLIAEATFLRSLGYFYLVRVFKDVPYIITPSISDNVDFYQPKTNGEEILEKIMADLNTNRDNAYDVFPYIEEEKGRATKAAYDALMADIALWQFKYQDAITYIEKFENAKRDVPIELVPTSRWFTIFYPGNSFESIFEFQFNQGLGQSNSMYGYTVTNSNNYLASKSAIQRLSREYVSELVRGEDASIKKDNETRYSIWKYVGRTDDGQTQRSGSLQSSCNWVVYRLADVKLMKAEALSQLGRYNEALTIINEIRDRAGVPSVSIIENAEAFEDAILEERCVELSYEGKRWFDLMRMGRRNNYARKDKLIDILVANVPSTQKRILGLKLSDPNGWYLPISKSELERNKNLEQNPYYK